MALSGYERVKRTRQRKAGKEPAPIERGQKAKAARELAKRTGASLRTAYRWLQRDKE